MRGKAKRPRIAKRKKQKIRDHQKKPRQAVKIDKRQPKISNPKPDIPIRSNRKTN